MRRTRSTASIRYAFDAQNRLTVKERNEAPARLGPVRVLEGTVTTDRQNRLVYRATSPLDPQGSSDPHTVSFEGSWSLTPEHALAFTLHEASGERPQTLYLRGAIVSAEANALVFALRRSEEEPSGETQRLVLSGRWQADARNRLSFLAARADGTEDRLTLQGGWHVGPRHEILYRYRRRAGSRPIERTLIFEGAWDITSSNRLVYRLSGSSDSRFEFRVSLRSPSLLAKNGRIVYEVGIGVSRGVTQRQRVALFGAWKVNRDLSVSFEIPYADGRVEAIRFEGQAALQPRDRVAVALKTGRGEGLGLTVTFTRELVPDVNLFLRLQRDAEERSVLGGVQVRF